MSDAKLRIRHAKRGNEKSIDLSNLGLSEIPAEILQLSALETVNVSGNRLSSLFRLGQLPHLREIVAQNNNVGSLHEELLDLYFLDSINLVGNPIVN